MHSGQVLQLYLHIFNTYQLQYFNMSLPPELVAKIKSIPMDPLALANNVQLAYMLSFSNYNVSSDSVQCSPKDSYNSPLESYSFVDFDENTYQTLLNQTRKSYELKNSTSIKCIRNSFKQFFTRVSAMTYSTALKKDQLFMTPSTSTIKIPTFQLEYKIDQMRGNNPNDWPRNLKQFYEQINKLPWNAFACEPQVYLEDFFSSAFLTLRNFVKKANANPENRSDFLRDISLIVEIIIMSSFKTNNQTFILHQLEVLNSLQLDKIFSQKQVHGLVAKLQSICNEIFEKIPVNEEQQYHMPKKLWEKGSAFMIMKKIHFQRQNGLGFYSVTNDGTYLYIYVSSVNGGMFKIGTGKNSSIAGKIYLEKQIFLPVGSKLDQVNWVFLKGKLYLKTSSREPSILQVINPENFKSQGTLEIRCPSLFGHQSLININRNSILLTDGQRLYYLGRQLRITQSKEEHKVVIQEEQDSKVNKKKKNKKQKNNQQVEQGKPKPNNPEQIDKVVQIVLCEFDVQLQLNQDGPEQLAQQLFNTFNNYFTRRQCMRALYFCQNDLSEAAQWLVDQGQKERTTKVLYPTSKVIIAEAEINSNFSEKNLKGSNQIPSKQGSLLHTQNVNQSIWTMDQQEITCFSENGIKIFSKSSADIHNINENSSLKTTHLKTFEGKFLRNPQYSINYDPYNRIFYTFTWPTDGGHYFPTAVLIGSDHKRVAELSHQKKISLSQNDPRLLSEFSKWVLTKMNLLDNTHCPDQGRINNWLWWFAQKIVELNKQINANNELDKKKLINKRSKYLTKMNRVNEYYKIYQKDKKQFEEKGKTTTEIKFIHPFSSDGSLQNLVKIRNIYGKQLQPDEVYDFIFSLSGWLVNSLKITSPKIRQQLYLIRSQLISLKDKLNLTTVKKLNKLFINHFFEFFETKQQQIDFIVSLDKSEIESFIQKHHQSSYRSKKSIVYETKNKDNIMQKYESKNKFEQIFPTVSNVTIKQLQLTQSIGNLLTSPARKQKNKIIKFLQKQIVNGPNGIKLFEYIFLEAFRSLVKQKKYEQYAKQLQDLFVDTFSLILSVVSQANLNLLKNLSDPINQIVQLYFASLCSFQPSVEIIEILLKILQQMQKKDVSNLLKLLQDMQFEGISQTFEKNYETPHPIERGKNQSFPPLKNSEASLIYAEFDKRCQSDPNHDNLSIQITHQSSPVGNSISCNDGVFHTSLRLTGKLDSGKPYLILGNSVNIDFVSSGHAKDAKSFGRFGFKFGLRPIFAGKIKYKKQGSDKIEKVFGSKSEFEKYVNTLKLLTVTISNSIQNLINSDRQQKNNSEVSSYLKGKIFKQGFEQQIVFPITQKSNNLANIEHILGENSKYKTDGRIMILKVIHSESIKKNPNKQQKLVPKNVDAKQKSIAWDIQGIPGYIKSYVQKIKKFSGDFIQIFQEARKLALPKGLYSTQLLKPSFKQDMRRLWLQGQAILFLTVLKHSGLLHLNIKFSIQYIKANLKAFQEARNGIFNKLITRTTSIRQWRDLLQTYQDKKNQKQQEEEKTEKVQEPQKITQRLGIQIKKKGMATKTIKIQNKVKSVNKTQKKAQKKEEEDKSKEKEKRKKQIEAQIRQRLSNQYRVKSVCSLKNIQFNPKELYSTVTKILAKLEEQSKQNLDFSESVYVQPINHLIRSCLFLLKLKSSSTKQSINNDQQELQPEQIVRSYSQGQQVNLNKVNKFREWLENWKKWKDFKKEDKVQLKFPVSQIIQFVNSWIPLEKFREQIELRYRNAENRIKFYELNQNLVKNTSSSFLNKYVFGAEVSNIKGQHNSGLQSVSNKILSKLQQRYNDYSNILRIQEEKKFKQLPLKLKQIQNLMKNEPENILQKIKLIALHLYLIQCENPIVDLDIPMFFIPIRFLNNSSQELIFISALIIHRAFLTNHSFEQIVSKLWKQVGNDSISTKRWRDYFFIERLLFLLRKLENKCRHRLQVGQKQKAAQILFYLIYHLEVPLLCRVCLRILNLLKISFKSNINTPFQKTYKAVTFNQKNHSIEQFTISNNKSYNNIEIIAAKCYEMFRGQFKNEIKERLLTPFKNIGSQNQNEETYSVIFNMNQQEDVVWMLSALYYLEEIQKTITPIKDWEEYLSKKNKKKEHKDKEKDKEKEKQKQKEVINQQSVVNIPDKTSRKALEQRLFQNIPNGTYPLPQQLEKELPTGWFFNYCNIYNEYTLKPGSTQSQNVQNAPNLSQKKNRNANQPANQNTSKKPWNAVEFMKLFKKFEELTSKPLQEPKDEQPEENKVEFIKGKNFISRMRKHCAQVSYIFSNLSQNGYYVFREEVTKQKCQIICQLFTLAGTYRLKAIPCDFKVKDYATRLSPVFVVPSKKSELKITCIKTDQYKRFNQLMNAPLNVSTRVQNNSLLYYTMLSSNEYTLQDMCHLPYQEFPQVESREEQEDVKIQFSKYFIESSFCRMKKRQDEVYLRSYPKLRYQLSQGGLQSGLVSCTLIPTFDSNLASQKSSMDEIFSAEPKYETDQEPEVLLEKSINLLKKQFTQIKQKGHIIPYMLLCSYLEKLSKVNMEFLQTKIVKQFQDKLSKFISTLKADRSIEEYKEKIQVLTTKMLDSENKNLQQFRLYRYDDERTHEDLIKFVDNDKLKSSLRQQVVEKAEETMQTHQFQKSNYLLPTHTPIPEQNKLLKYWEKNILPKILDFVKSSLKPLQIQDFFEQMRIPLRKGDQLEAKKIAYVICDNKLPQGAVLPDANHNWNSLTIEDVHVGQDVLLRLSKSKYESSSPLLCCQSQEYRAAQIMFIDQKNFSVLVRHRLNEYAIFVYSWVPINSIQTVEQSLAHYSTQSINRQLQQSFKGLIYNYSKICLTSISKKIKINMQYLIQETIVDIFRNNPVSGWSEEKEWPLKYALKNQLSEGNHKVAQIIENKFCPIKSYDVDLYSENILKLNNAENSLGLIVEFKKSSTLIWYSGIKFYADQYGFKEIANTYASKSCVNELSPLEFKNPNVYCRYYRDKQFLKAVDQGKYEQKQLIATVFPVDPVWTVSTYLANVIGQIAEQSRKYEDILIRFNRVFLKWLQKRQAIYLSTQLCRLVTKNTLRIKKILTQKQQTITLQKLGASEQQIKSFLQWINLIKQEQDKDILVLYSPLLQNLIEMISSLLHGLEKTCVAGLNQPSYIQQIIKMIQMITEIQNNIRNKIVKKEIFTNDTQWERILVIENVPLYFNQKYLKQKIKAILAKNSAKILAPAFDVFYSSGKLVILVDSWDITELIEEEVMEKIQNEQEKQPQPEQQQGLLMQWACQACTFFNPVGNVTCGMCEAPAPQPKNEIVYEKVEAKDVNKAEQKLREKQKKRFDSVKEQIKLFIDEYWKQHCKKIDEEKEAEEKLKEEKRKKKGKANEIQEKVFEKPQKPNVILSSGSQVLQKEVVEEFLKNRFNNLPQQITRKVKGEEDNTYLDKFKELVKLGFDLWGDNISNQSPKLLELEYLSQLMQYIQDEICKGSSSVLSYNESSIRMISQIPLLKDDDEQPLNFATENNVGVKAKYKNLSNEKSYNIRYSWKIIRDLNLAASKCLGFINMAVIPNERGQIITSTNTIGANLKNLRQLIMGALKLELFQKIMQKTSVMLEGQDIPKISLERLKVKQDSHKINKLITSKDKDQFLYTKAHEQLQKVSSINLRPFKPKGTQPYLSFSVNFKGELVQGQAGPYRQFFTDISNELHPDNGLNLFIKTPNNVHSTGQGRQKWTINPKANSIYYLSLFHFLGRLMGCCIRTGLHLPIEIANFCWKLITDEKIKKSDIIQLDIQFHNLNNLLLECSESDFDDIQISYGEPVTWTYKSVDGEEKEMKPNGKTLMVRYEERVKYIEMMQQKRIEEIRLQVNKIKEGLYEMVPESFFNHISGEELKTMICGVPKVDVDLLKKHTKYAGGLTQQTPIIKFFWQMMRQIKEEQRLKLIRFCWGQERLPLNSQQFERNGIRFMIKPMLNNRNPDQALPKADTCFFNIELPTYSTKEILKQKLLLAINYDNVSINGDRNQPDDNPLMENVQYEEEDEEEDDGEGGGGGG